MVDLKLCIYVQNYAATKICDAEMYVVTIICNMTGLILKTLVLVCVHACV